MKSVIHFSHYVLNAIAKVKDYIDQHPLEWTGTKELAIYAGINRVTLQKGFRHVNGIKISKYQKQIRMEAACIMLAEGKMTKKEIAFKCGYQNQNNFGNAFKEVKKMSPGEWQKRNANR